MCFVKCGKRRKITVYHNIFIVDKDRKRDRDTKIKMQNQLCINNTTRITTKLEQPYGNESFRHTNTQK